MAGRACIILGVLSCWDIQFWMTSICMVCDMYNSRMELCIESAMFDPDFSFMIRSSFEGGKLPVLLDR